MPPEKDGLQFSNFDLSENHENDTREGETQKNYNPISEITKLESFGFEFEPDEDIDEDDRNQIVINSNQEKVSNEKITAEVIADKVDEDVLLMPEDDFSITSDNITEQKNTDVQGYQDDFDYVKDNTLSKFDNNEIGQILSENENSLDQTDSQLDFSDLTNEIALDNNFEVLDDINISTQRETSNDVIEDDQNILRNNINSSGRLEDELMSSTNLENSEYLSNDSKEISEEEAEDILAQVMSQDFTTPIEGFEKYAEIKRIRSEASKALEGSSYSELDIDFNNEDEEVELGGISTINTEEDLKKIDSTENEEINSNFENEILDDDEELELYSDDDEEIGQNAEERFDNVDLSDIVDLDDVTVGSNIDEIFEDLEEDNLEITSDNANTTIDDIDISNIININIDDENDDELDLLFGDDKEDLIDDEQEIFNNEFEQVDLGISNNKEDRLEDEFGFDDINQGKDDDEIDDDGFNLDLGGNDDDDDSDDDLADDFDFDDLDQKINDSGVDDGDFNIDLGSSDDNDDLDDEFNFDDLDQQEDDGGFDDGGFDIDFGSSEDNDDNEFNFDDASLDEEFSDSGEFDFDDVNFSGDFEDDNNNEIDFDSFDEDDFGEELGYSQESEEFTSATNEYLEKLKKLKNSFPDLSKAFTAKTKEYLRKIQEIKTEMKEEGFKPTSKKYSKLASVQTVKLFEDISRSIQKKLQTKQNSKKKNSKTENNDNNKKVNVKLDEWDGGSGDDAWGLGPVNQSNEEDSNESPTENDEEAEADWDDSEEFSFSTADMLMDDEELGLEEFSGFGEASRGNKEEEEEDLVDYTGVLGKFRRIKKVLYKWSKLIYKYFDSKIDFEKNWWKVIDFFAVVVLMTAFAMVLAYYLWHK